MYIPYKVAVALTLSLPKQHSIQENLTFVTLPNVTAIMTFAKVSALVIKNVIFTRQHHNVK